MSARSSVAGARAVASAGRALGLLAVAVGLGGCLMLLKVPGMVDELSDLSVSGVEYFHYEGLTKYAEPYRVRYWLDAEQGKRYRVVVVAGKTLESSWENVAAELAAAEGVWGAAWRGRSEAEVRATFGPPSTVTDAGGVRTLWYLGRADGAWGVIFSGGRLLAAFRTTPGEVDELLARRFPY
jgi:hypothetical protein